MQRDAGSAGEAILVENRRFLYAAQSESCTLFDVTVPVQRRHACTPFISGFRSDVTARPVSRAVSSIGAADPSVDEIDTKSVGRRTSVNADRTGNPTIQ